MSKPKIRIYDCETNETIDREMNSDEFAKYEAEQLSEAKRKAEIDTLASAKSALLKKLGITAEEAVLLLL
jgi:hypothetical protein